MRVGAEQSRASIQRAALETFCERGYRATTLEEIGARVGVTRGTVLHHFHSKGELLAAAVGPYRRAVADLLNPAHAAEPAQVGEPQAGEPPTRSQRRQLLTALSQVFLQHRSAVQLLATDVGARVQLGLTQPLGAPSERLVTLLLGHGADCVGRVRVTAALGSMILPVISDGVDLRGPRTESELVEAALVVLERRAPSVPRAGSTPGAVSARPRPAAQVAGR